MGWGVGLWGGEVQGGSFSDLSDGATACGPTATEAPTDVLGELPHSSPLFGGIFLNCLEFRVKSRHKQRTFSTFNVVQPRRDLREFRAEVRLQATVTKYF